MLPALLGIHTQIQMKKDKQRVKERPTNKLWCSKHLSTLDVVGQLACKSKVNNLQLLVVCQHQIFRLHTQLTALLSHDCTTCDVHAKSLATKTTSTATSATSRRCRETNVLHHNHCVVHKYGRSVFVSCTSWAHSMGP